MAKAKYETADSTVQTMVEKIINTFPDKFIHIVPNDLCLMFRDVAKSSYKAKTKLLGSLYSKLVGKKLLIEFHKQEWENSTENQKAFMVYHELFHIGFDDEKNEYKLRKHDVKGFYDMLSKMGLNYENAETFFSSALNPKTTHLNLTITK